MQLFNTVRNVSQPLEGHAASFANISLDASSTPNKVFAFAARTANGAKVNSVSNLVEHY